MHAIPGNKLLEVLLEAEILQKKAAIEKAVRENPRLLATPKDTVTFDELQTYGQDIQPQFLAAAIERVVPSAKQQREHLAQANAVPTEHALLTYYGHIVSLYERTMRDAIGSNATILRFMRGPENNQYTQLYLYEKELPRKRGIGIFTFTTTPETYLADVKIERAHRWHEEKKLTFTVDVEVYQPRFMAVAWPAVEKVNALFREQNTWHWTIEATTVKHHYAVIK